MRGDQLSLYPSLIFQFSSLALGQHTVCFFVLPIMYAMHIYIYIYIMSILYMYTIMEFPIIVFSKYSYLDNINMAISLSITIYYGILLFFFFLYFLL